MKDIVRTRSGAMWREVESIQEAKDIGSATQTAFGIFFEQEQKSGVLNRYFALGEDFRVIGCVPLSPPPYRGSHARGMPLFVAHKNENPFPSHQREIEELSLAVGAEILPTHYPYGRRVDQSSEYADDDPAPGK